MARAAGRWLDAALVLAAAGLAIVIVRAAVTDVDRDPLDLPSLRDLAVRLDRQGRLAQADAILGFVGGRTWRDGPTEVWLLRRRLDQGRYREAFESADSLLRRDAGGTTRPVLFPLLVAAADDPDARPALVARLATAPWWRGDFLRTLGEQGDVAGTQAVLSTLARGPRPPTADEYAPFVDRIVSAADYRGAASAWRAIAGSGEAPTLVLRDGDFKVAADHTPFTWSAASGVGASSDAGPTSGGAVTRTLRVDYDGYSWPSLPAQLLVDPPRRYTLTWLERLDPAAPERLAWRVRCADTGRVLARARTAVPGWRTATMVVRTPPSGCAAQWLELAAEPGERRGPVTGRYAAFRMRPGR